jgi:hypothetical protein
MDSSSSPFWLDDPGVLFNRENRHRFIIVPGQNKNQKLNSIARFSVYLGIVLAMYKTDANYFLVALVGLFLSVMMKHAPILKNTIIKESFEEEDLDSNDETEKFTKPTINNPFGNSSIYDILENPDRPPMIDYVSNTEEANKAKKQVEDSFNSGLYKDLGDVYNKKHSQREFYTTPSKGMIPPDPNGDFKKWLYGGMKSAKHTQYRGSSKIYESLVNTNINNSMSRAFD